MFDTHCHLNNPDLIKDVKAVIANAHEAGVKQMLVPGYDLNSSKEAITITNSYQDVFAAVGIHPTAEISQTSEEVLSEIKNIAKLPSVVAIGEVGLDYFRSEIAKKDQISLLEKQIHLAIDLKKSLILHNRESTDDLLTVLAKNWDSKLNGKVVFHFAQPEEKILNFALKNQAYLGFDGDITYDPRKQSFLQKVPLNLLVFETDSPYILPEPERSLKKYPNNPSNLALIIQKAAEILDNSVESLITISSENAARLFLYN